MAIKTKEELVANLTKLIGDNNSDENLALLEDVSDTYDDLCGKAETGTDWKAKYEENDKEWRQKYRERFETPTSHSEDSEIENVEGDNEENPVPMTFEELFKEGD